MSSNGGRDGIPNGLKKKEQKNSLFAFCGMKFIMNELFLWRLNIAIHSNSHVSYTSSKKKKNSDIAYVALPKS